MRGTGWKAYLMSPDEKPELTWDLMRRVIGYARPCRFQIIEMFILIVGTTGLGLLTPLIMRYLIDHVIPSGNIKQIDRKLVSVSRSEPGAEVAQSIIGCGCKVLEARFSSGSSW